MISPDRKHQVVLLPGLGDDVSFVGWATRSWIDQNCHTHVHRVGWHDEEDLSQKLERLASVVDQVAEMGPVSVVGISAGGSLALNLFLLYKERIEKAINVCGRLRRGNSDRTWRSLEHTTKNSPSFRESVEQFERLEHLLSAEDRQRVMTVQSSVFDELVPPETVPVEGAHNIEIPVPEHVVAIAYSLLSVSDILEFILKE